MLSSFLVSSLNFDLILHVCIYTLAFKKCQRWDLKYISSNATIALLYLCVLDPFYRTSFNFPNNIHVTHSKEQYINFKLVLTYYLIGSSGHR